MADVEMKSAADSKPAEEAKKEDAKKEEPTDHFYGKLPHPSTHSCTLEAHRTEEIAGTAGEGRQGQGLQDLCIINQIIQKAAQDLQPCGRYPRHQVLLA